MNQPGPAKKKKSTLTEKNVVKLLQRRVLQLEKAGNTAGAAETRKELEAALSKHPDILTTPRGPRGRKAANLKNPEAAASARIDTANRILANEEDNDIEPRLSPTYGTNRNNYLYWFPHTMP